MPEMKGGRHRVIPWAGALFFVGLLTVNTMPLQATVHDLRYAVLRAGEAPPGFSHPHLTVYPHFVKAMRDIRPHSDSDTGIEQCYAPTTFAHDGWVQGLIETFRGEQMFRGFELCGFLFRSLRRAHDGYLVLAAGAKSLLTHKRGTRLTRRGFGDESFSFKPFEGLGESTEIVWRHDNAVMLLSYFGPPVDSQLVRDAGLIDRRLSSGR